MDCIFARLFSFAFCILFTCFDVLVFCIYVHQTLSIVIYEETPMGYTHMSIRIILAFAFEIL